MSEAPFEILKETHLESGATDLRQLICSKRMKYFPKILQNNEVTRNS